VFFGPDTKLSRGGSNMKVIIHPKGVILQGKAWEIRAKLKEYSYSYEYIKEWTKSAGNEKQ
jgi:hypothetical protein